MVVFEVCDVLLWFFSTAVDTDIGFFQYAIHLRFIHPWDANKCVLLKSTDAQFIKTRPRSWDFIPREPMSWWILYFQCVVSWFGWTYAKFININIIYAWFIKEMSQDHLSISTDQFSFVRSTYFYVETLPLKG